MPSAKKSAGILLYRRTGGVLEVFLIHPGGPLFAKRDLGSWSVPKGEYDEGEEPLAAARREFEEETGFPVGGNFIPLSPIRQKSGKVVTAWAVEGDFDPSQLQSNLFTLEWPPGSGKQRHFPEVDRGDWFPLPAARSKINPAQIPLLDQLEQHLL